MKIAQIAPLYESCPPRLYGGTERIVSYLTEELVRQGHDVTLFASADSCTSAKLEPFCDVALRLDPRIKDPLPHHIAMLDAVRTRADEFDVLHFHVDVLHYPLIRDFVEKTVTTLHGRLDMEGLAQFYSRFSAAPLVSISNDQRKPMPPVNWAGMVYHGLPRDLLPFNPSPKGDYLAFLGRISPEKGPVEAIEIATRAGARLKMAAKIDRVDADYWTDVVKPMVDAHPNVEFVGEINERQKPEFLGNASALLFPINWPEPFGLVMIEAIACGTPVIAFPKGSAPEVIDHGVSGYLVENVDQAVAAVSQIHAFDRAGARAAFDRRFTIERVTRDYLSIYRSLIEARTPAPGRWRSTLAVAPSLHAPRGTRAPILNGRPKVPATLLPFLERPQAPPKD
jgi:glycosyltransferase involved in cell wall biosynthesis